MKNFRQVLSEQAEYVKGLRKTAKVFAKDIDKNFKADAILLSGSVARGDARNGKYGLRVDLTVITENGDADFSKTYGPSNEPGIPFYCRDFQDAGFQIKQISLAKFYSPNNMESECFALAESIVLVVNNSEVDTVLERLYPRKQAPRKELAMKNYWRFKYLCGDYRYEKWESREAYTQLVQNFHEAFECFCSFIYAVNGSFIPRKDWLVYLLPEQEIKPEGIDSLIDALVSVLPARTSIEKGKLLYNAVGEWMETISKTMSWI